MIPVRFAIVPIGGGETDHCRDAVLPAIPSKGDAITWFEESESGTNDFVVRRVIWPLAGTQDHSVELKMSDRVIIEVEFAVSALSSEVHRRSANMYAEQSRAKPEIIDSSAY